MKKFHDLAASQILIAHEEKFLIPRIIYDSVTDLASTGF